MLHLYGFSGAGFLDHGNLVFHIRRNWLCGIGHLTRIRVEYRVLRMEPYLIAAFVRPFLLVIIAFAVLYPVRKVVERYMRDSKWKRLLLRRIN